MHGFCWERNPRSASLRTVALCITMLCLLTNRVNSFAIGLGFIPKLRNSVLGSGSSRRLMHIAMQQQSKYPPGSLEASIVEQLFSSLQQGVDQRKSIADLPQGSAEWLRARQNRLTASNFGAAVGRNRFMSPEKLAQEMLNSTFKGNDATRWGNEKEAVAVEQYLKKKTKEVGHGFSVTHSGLHICAEYPWLAASPDGHVHEGGSTGLLEIKCPFSKKMYPNGIPEYYVDQIQGLMAILGYEWADFVVWTPSNMRVERVPFDRAYWENSLFPGLLAFYDDVFIPAYLAFQLKQRTAAAHPPSPSPSPPPSSPRVTDLGARSQQSPAPPGRGKSSQQPPPLRPTPSLNSINPAPPSSRSSGRGGAAGRGSAAPAAPPATAPAGEADLSMLAAGAGELRARLGERGMELEFVSGNADSVLVAVLTQLRRQGRLPAGWEAAMAADPERAVEEARWEVVAEVAAHRREYEALMGVDSAGLKAQLEAMAEGRAAVRGAELTAVARAFGARVTCFLVSEGRVHERVLGGERAGEGEGEEGAGGEVVVGTAGAFFWSTRAVGGGDRAGRGWREEWREGGGSAGGGGPQGGAEGAGEVVDGGSAGSGRNVRQRGAARTEEVRKVGEERGATAAGEAARGGEGGRGAEVRAEGAGVGKGEGSSGRGGGEGFTSNYSPLFQKCVIDVEAKLRPSQRNSLEGAFRICNRSLGSRKFGEHATRRDGSSVGDPERIAKQYQALLVRHSLTAKSATPPQSPPPSGPANGSK